LASERSTDIKVGLTVIVGIVLLLLGIGWAKNASIFGSNEQEVLVRFESTGGLAAGEPVLVNGVKSGGVSKVEQMSKYVLVTLKFPNPQPFRKNATANIAMLELMGGKKVEMTLGDAPDKLNPKDTLDGHFNGDIGTLVKMVTDLSGVVTSLTGRADSIFGSINTFFRDNDLKGTVNKTMQDAQQTLEHFDITAHKLNGMLDDNAGPIKRTIAQAESATRDLADFLKSDRPLIHALLDTTSLVMHDARTLVLRATDAIGNVDSLLAGASRNNTLLFKLTKDVAFSNRLDSMVTNLNKFIEQLRTQGLDANIRFFQSSKPAP
jgi:phospholipid/cholesterol/gamma-HCH transport system substrate-binding protein